MKGPGSTMTILRLTSNLKKEKISWFGDVSGGLANDKGYILIQSILLFPKTSINSIVNFNNIGGGFLTSADFSE
jgi:hypothetical protein